MNLPCLQIHNDALKDGAANKKYIRLGSATESRDTNGITADDLFVTAVESLQKTKKRRGPFALTLVKVCENLHRFSRAIDTFVQYDPTVASLVWGSVRVLLQASQASPRYRRSSGF